MDKPELAILMCTYNGEEFISDQVNSIFDQEFKNWHLWVSDDNSQDNTLGIIKTHPKYNGNKVSIVSGPCKGFSENFKSLIHTVPLQSDFYAFSDQDDIWLPDKLERATDFLKKIPSTVPAMYCSCTELIDENNAAIGFSPRYRKKPSFKNALLQNIGSGNTMVFNRRALELLRIATSADFVIHDWALYLAVSACGGSIFFDENVSVRYRQHQANLIGNGMSLRRRIDNFIKAYQWRRYEWNTKNIAMLSALTSFMTPESRNTLEYFSSIRNGRIYKRWVNLHRSGVYHQQAIGMLTTIALTLSNRM